MRNFRSAFFVFLLALVLPLTAKEYKYQTVKGDLTKTRIYTLDNGLTVYLSVNNEKPRIQTYIAVRTGSRNDPPETTGLAHYLEHLMFKGTRQFGTIDAAKEAVLLDSIQNRFEVYRTLKDSLQRRAYYQQIDSLSQLAAKYFIPNEYDKLMSSIGAQGTNAYTSNDVTCYVENIPANEIASYVEQTLSLTREFALGDCRLRLQAEVVNLADKQYEVIKYYPMPGRAWRLGGTFSF